MEWDDCTYGYTCLSSRPGQDAWLPSCSPPLALANYLCTSVKEIGTWFPSSRSLGGIHPMHVLNLSASAVQDRENKLPLARFASGRLQI